MLHCAVSRKTRALPFWQTPRSTTLQHDSACNRRLPHAPTKPALPPKPVDPCTSEASSPTENGCPRCLTSDGHLGDHAPTPGFSHGCFAGLQLADTSHPGRPTARNPVDERIALLPTTDNEMHLSARPCIQPLDRGAQPNQRLRSRSAPLGRPPPADRQHF